MNTLLIVLGLIGIWMIVLAIIVLSYNRRDVDGPTYTEYWNRGRRRTDSNNVQEKLPTKPQAAGGAK